MTIKSKQQARKLAMQALYQWQISQTSLSEIERQFLDRNETSQFDQSYFHELLHQIPKQLSTVDQAYEGYLDRAIDSLDPVERAILRLSTYEMIERLEVPYRVVINEAVELSKSFGATGSHRYINGILDQVARVYRQAEMGS